MTTKDYGRLRKDMSFEGVMVSVSFDDVADRKMYFFGNSLSESTLTLKEIVERSYPTWSSCKVFTVNIVDDNSEDKFLFEVKR